MAGAARRPQTAVARWVPLGSLRWSRLEPYLYLLPALAGIGVWVYWPLVSTAELSLYQWNLLPNIPKRPVGLDNYASVLTLPEMGQALINTAIYVAALLPFSVVFPLSTAILVANIGGRWHSVYRAVLFLPELMAPVVVAFVWRWILHPTQGVLNAALVGWFGLPPLNVFRDPHQAIWGVVGITAWMLMGFSVLIFSAALTNVGRDYLQAAEVDGASRWQVIRFILLPLVSPTIVFMTLLTVLLSALWTFPIVNVLTSGGPFNSTTNVYYLLWEFGFHNFNVGFTSAAAVLFFAGFGLLAWLFICLSDRYSFYDA